MTQKAPNQTPRNDVTLKDEKKDAQAQQRSRQKILNIDSVVRPIIESATNLISEQFLSSHNKYLLQSYQRKSQCFQKFLLPPQIKVNTNPNTKTKSKNQKQPFEPLNTKPQEPYKPTSDQVLQYYDCFDNEIDLSVQRYQKLYKKTQQNKIMLINCVQKCSSNSKQQPQIFQQCSQNCKNIYTERIKKLYANFYTKFLDKQ